MTTSYPTALDTTTRFPATVEDDWDAASGIDAGTTTAAGFLAQWMRDAGDALRAIEAELGPDPSGTYSTVADRIAAASGDINVYNVVTDYGAPTDGTTNASSAFRAAEAAAYTAGGGICWVPRIAAGYRINRVEVRSGVYFLIEGGTKINMLTTIDGTTSQPDDGTVSDLDSRSTRLFVLGDPYTFNSNPARHKNCGVMGVGGYVTFDLGQLGYQANTANQNWTAHAIGVYNVDGWCTANIECIGNPMGCAVYPTVNGASLDPINGIVDNIRMFSFGRDHVQTVTQTAAMTLTFGGQTTGSIATGQTPATVQTALQGLSTIGATNALVTGPTGGPFVVTFANELGGINVPTMSATGATVANTTPGVIPGFGPIQWTAGRRASIRHVYTNGWCPVSWEMDAAANSNVEDVYAADLWMKRPPNNSTSGWETGLKFTAGRITGQENNKIRRVTVDRVYVENACAVQYAGIGTMSDITIKDLVQVGNGFAANGIEILGTWTDAGNMLLVNPKIDGSRGDGMYAVRDLNSMEMQTATITNHAGYVINFSTGTTAASIVRFNGRTVCSATTGYRNGSGTIYRQQEESQTITYNATTLPGADPYKGRLVQISAVISASPAVAAPLNADSLAGTAYAHAGAEITYVFQKDASATARVPAFTDARWISSTNPSFATASTYMTITFRCLGGSNWIETSRSGSTVASTTPLA